MEEGDEEEDKRDEDEGSERECECTWEEETGVTGGRGRNVTAVTSASCAGSDTARSSPRTCAAGDACTDPLFEADDDEEEGVRADVTIDEAEDDDGNEDDDDDDGENERMSTQPVRVPTHTYVSVDAEHRRAPATTTSTVTSSVTSSVTPFMTEGVTDCSADSNPSPLTARSIGLCAAGA